MLLRYIGLFDRSMVRVNNFKVRVRVIVRFTVSVGADVRVSNVMMGLTVTFS